MEIFETDCKVNFVDEHNVFVGYDLSQCCCEYADWFIANAPACVIPSTLNKPDKCDGFLFDIDYFKKVDCCDCSILDAGNMVIFKLTNGESSLFLHLFNCHNGYYSHGFKMMVQDQIKHEDDL